MGKAQHDIPFSEAFKVWVRVALNSFGGPAGQIAVMHKILVEEKRWLKIAGLVKIAFYTL